MANRARLGRVGVLLFGVAVTVAGLALLVPGTPAWADAAAEAPAVPAQDPMNTWIGFGCVLLVAAFSILVVARGHRWVPDDEVSVYRPYERKLLLQGRLDLADMLDYHAQYKWGEYAAVTIGMVLISTTILALDAGKLVGEQVWVQGFAVFFMTTAAIMLCWADLVHTNTQTPLIPLDRRFHLINVSVSLGTAGTLMMLLAVLLFVCIISLAATLLCLAVYVGLLLYTYRARRIKKRALFEYFRVYDAKEWPEDAEYVPEDDGCGVHVATYEWFRRNK